MTVRVRIAPSPTGNLHLGTARTALFNWLFARHHGGEFILRIEDTDKERSTKAFEANIIEGLHWLGITWDNPEIIRQSERGAVYREYLERMLAQGTAVWRQYTPEEQAEMVASGRTAREKVIILAPKGDQKREIAFDDVIRGRVAVAQEHIGQLVLAKDLDTPLYNFAVVVDDIDMQITHVIRGEDHISNTPKQLLIYEALGASAPIFAHLPLILGSDRSKMSKRDGATSISEYQADYLPQALVNFLGRLGYTYEEELISLDDMASQFDLSRVHSSGAVFDVKKLNWTNAQYVRKLTPDEFRLVTGVGEISDLALPIITERLERLSEVGQFSYLWKDVSPIPTDLCYTHQTPDDAARALSLCLVLLDGGTLTKEQLDALATQHFDGQKGRVFWPLRVALSGLRASAGPLDIMAVIGEDKVRRRLEHAIELLQS